MGSGETRSLTIQSKKCGVCSCALALLSGSRVVVDRPYDTSRKVLQVRARKRNRNSGEHSKSLQGASFMLIVLELASIALMAVVRVVRVVRQ